MTDTRRAISHTRRRPTLSVGLPTYVSINRCTYLERAGVVRHHLVALGRAGAGALLQDLGFWRGCGATHRVGRHSRGGGFVETDIDRIGELQAPCRRLAFHSPSCPAPHRRDDCSTTPIRTHTTRKTATHLLEQAAVAADVDPLPVSHCLRVDSVVWLWLGVRYRRPGLSCPGVEASVGSRIRWIVSICSWNNSTIDRPPQGDRSRAGADAVANKSIDRNPEIDTGSAMETLDRSIESRNARPRSLPPPASLADFSNGREGDLDNGRPSASPSLD